MKSTSVTGGRTVVGAQWWRRRLAVGECTAVIPVTMLLHHKLDRFVPFYPPPNEHSLTHHELYRFEAYVHILYYVCIYFVCSSIS